MKEGLQHQDIDFSLLGKELIHVDDDENAIYSYQRRLDWVWYEGTRALSHSTTCDSCGTDPIIKSSRYVCRICPDFDLCHACYERYTRGIYSERTCKVHSFLPVPIPTFSSKEEPDFAVEVDREAIHKWLNLLEAKYTADTVSRVTAGLSDGFPDPTWLELTMGSLHWLGYLRFHTLLTRLPQLLSWPQVESVRRYEGYVILNSDKPEDNNSIDENMEFDVD